MIIHEISGIYHPIKSNEYKEDIVFTLETTSTIIQTPGNYTYGYFITYTEEYELHPLYITGHIQEGGLAFRSWAHDSLKYKDGDTVTIYVSLIFDVLFTLQCHSNDNEYILHKLNDIYNHTPNFYKSLIKYSFENNISYIVQNISKDVQQIINVELNTNHRM